MLEDAVKYCLITGIIEKSGVEPDTKSELIDYLMKLAGKRMPASYIEVEPLRKFILDRIYSDNPNTALSYDAAVILSYIDNAQTENLGSELLPDNGMRCIKEAPMKYIIDKNYSEVKM